MPAISVIVPIYNVESYLPDCINSILTQSFEDIEILLLNDGSTDGSLDICNEYELIDDRIRVYSHNNIGLGPTRNVGISVAKGEYLAFVDSDDFISKDGLKKLYEKAKSIDADIVQAETIVYHDLSNCCLRYSLDVARDVSLNPLTLEQFYKDYYFTRIYTHNAWDKIYKKTFIDNNNIMFGDNTRIFAEDNWFQLQLIRLAPTIGFVHEKYYYYRQQSESIMHKPKKELVFRHGNMINDYNNLISDSSNIYLEKQVNSIVAADIFTMIALDLKRAKSFRSKAVSEFDHIPHNIYLKNAISDLYRLKGYQLYSNNRMREYYLAIIGFLYYTGLYRFAHIIIWILYSIR